VQAAFTRRWGARAGVLAQALIFGLLHYQVGMDAAEVLLTVIAIGLTGLLLGVFRSHYERLGPGMVAHGAFNAVAVAVAFAVT